MYVAQKKFKKSIFFKPKFPKLAKKISIRNPSAFRRSIRKLKKGGLTLREKRGLVLARTRAKISLKRKNLSRKEKKQMRKISKMRI